MPNIILKNREGEDVAYENVWAVQLKTEGGGTQTFIANEPVAKTVELDFSEGDMEIVPEDGKVFSGVSVPKPTTLTPGNIAEGVTIAGILGTLASVGGGAKVAYGSFVATEKITTIEHGLEVVPDIVIIETIYPWVGTGTSEYKARAIVGKSASLKESLSATLGIIGVVQKGNTNTFYYSSSSIEGTDGFINKANENSVTFGYGTYVTPINQTHFWLAIALR